MRTVQNHKCIYTRIIRDIHNSNAIILIMNDFYSIIIIIGIFLTFVPQQVRIIQKKTSLGLSPHFMLLGITSVLSQLINILVMQIPVLDECRRTSEHCFSNVLGIVQVVVLTLCIGTNCLLFLIFYPKPYSALAEGREVIKCLQLFVMYCVFCSGILLPTFLIWGKDAPSTRNVGQFFGIFCTILSCIQYVPQIMRTWLTKRVGALSMTTLAIQAPGSYFFAYTIASSPATDITTWGAFFISGTFQVILFGLCLYLGKNTIEEDIIEEIVEAEEEAGENRPLLAGNVV